MKHKQVFIFLILNFIVSVTYSQNVAVELEKMNVLYIGVENPINVVVGNHSSKKLVVKAKHGVVEPNYRGYIYKIDTCAYCMEIIYVGIKSVKGVKWIDSLYYRLKMIPDPIIDIGGKRSGFIKCDKLIMWGGLRVDYNDEFYEPTPYKFLSYSVEITRNDSIIYNNMDIKTRKYPEELILEIRNMQKGDVIRFYNCTILHPGNCERILEGPTFTLM